MKIFSFFLIGSLFILQTACRKVDTGKYQEQIKDKVKDKIDASIYGRNAGVLDWEDMYSTIDSNAVAVFGFSIFKTRFTAYNSGQFQGILRDSFVTNAYDIGFGTNTIAPNANKYYLLSNNNKVSPLYGDTVTINIKYKLGATTYLYSKNYKLPAKLELIPDINFDSLDAEVADGTLVEWIEDTTDIDSWIVISLDYNPKCLINNSMQDTTAKQKTLLVEDNGSYSFTDEDIDMFPDGGFVTVSIYRMAIRLDEDIESANGAKFAFGNVSCVIMSGKIVK